MLIPVQKRNHSLPKSCRICLGQKSCLEVLFRVFQALFIAVFITETTGFLIFCVVINFFSILSVSFVKLKTWDFCKCFLVYLNKDYTENSSTVIKYCKSAQTSVITRNSTKLPWSSFPEKVNVIKHWARSGKVLDTIWCLRTSELHLLRLTHFERT